MSAAFARHFTTTAATVTPIIETAVNHAIASDRLRVINRTGSSEVYFTVSVDPANPAPAPIVEGDETYVLSQTICEEFVPLDGLNGYLDVKVISAAATDVSVIIDNRHAGPR